MTQEDPEVTDANQGKHSLSSNILGAVLSGDYRLAADILNSISITTMTDAMKEKLLKVFSSFVEFEKQLKKKDKLNLIENEPQLNAMVDRYEAVLYDMGDLASEIEDRNTRIYLTIMAERLVELAKKFNNQSEISLGKPTFQPLYNMLYVIGLGLSDEKDITVRGLEAVKSCERVYLEAYTSILMVDSNKLSEYYGKQVIVADREMVESESDTILADAQNINVAFLVVGDPYGATTHTDLVIRARELNIPVQVIHNASIMNAIGACGLQLYNFGQTISIVFFTDTWRPDSFYDRIKENRDLGLHTLCLLDIKVKEQSIENLARGRKIYEPPRYMTVNQAVEQLLEVEDKRGEKAYTSETLAIGCARVGTAEQRLISGTLEQLLDADFGGPLHSLVLVGKRMHELEAEFVKEFAVDRSNFEEIVKKDYSH